MNISSEQKIKLFFWLKVILTVFVVVIAINFFTGLYCNKNGNEPVNTITLSGHGEVTAPPDIANVYFTISQDSKTVEAAQTLVVGIEKKSLDFLKTSNVLPADIQTANASFSPKYEYNQAICPPIPLGATTSASSPYYCPPSKQVITGYTASESITVKVRNIDNVGQIMQGLGALGVTDLSGPNFSIDNEDALKAAARGKAINDAKTKAEELVKELGVHLGKITSFNDSSNYPMPMYAKAVSMDSSSGASAPAAIPAGVNTITSDVTITYEIK